MALELANVGGVFLLLVMGAGIAILMNFIQFLFYVKKQANDNDVSVKSRKYPLKLKSTAPPPTGSVPRGIRGRVWICLQVDGDDQGAAPSQTVVRVGSVVDGQALQFSCAHARDRPAHTTEEGV